MHALRLLLSAPNLLLKNFPRFFCRSLPHVLLLAGDFLDEGLLLLLLRLELPVYLFNFCRNELEPLADIVLDIRHLLLEEQGPDELVHLGTVVDNVELALDKFVFRVLLCKFPKCSLIRRAIDGLYTHDRVCKSCCI